MKLGGDPAGEAKTTKGSTKVGELITHYLEYQKPRMKPRSYAKLARHLDTYFLGRDGEEDKPPLREYRPLPEQPASAVTQRTAGATQ